MKLRFIHFIPIIGMRKYYQEYFAADKRNFKEAKQAEWMNLYHLFVLVILSIFIVGEIF